MARDTDMSMVRWRVRKSRMAPLKKGAQLYNTIGVVRNIATQRRITCSSGLRSILNSGQVAMVAIIAWNHSKPATPNWRKARRFSLASC